jgi:formylglycine-generating enzyme required for sulfatase activity
MTVGGALAIHAMRKTPARDRAHDKLGFLPTVENTARPRGPAPAGMVWIPGGTFSMGAQDPPDMHDMVGMQATTDSRPIHRVYVDGFWMDATEVTNEQFSVFVEATGYRTVAERAPTAEEAPGVPAEDLVAGSVVFSPPDRAVPLDSHFRWWSRGGRTGATRWGGQLVAASEGSGGARAYEDAVAYATRPNACPRRRSGSSGGAVARPQVSLGDSFRDGRWMANSHRGHFPDTTPRRPFSVSHRWRSSHPTGSPDAGNAGSGERLAARAYAELAAPPTWLEPTWPRFHLDPDEPGVNKRVHRGGSFSAPISTARATWWAREARGVKTGTNHLGFRCVK